MKHTRTLLTALLLTPLVDPSAADSPDTNATVPGKPAASAAKAVFQYKADDIAIPTATADEPKTAAFGAESIRAAAKYLDDGASAWARSRSCITEHVARRLQLLTLDRARRGNLPSPNANFVGREPELASLRAALLDAPEQSPAGIHGVGGMGKTALAQAFAYKEADAFPGGCSLLRCDGSANNTSCSLISQ